MNSTYYCDEAVACKVPGKPKMQRTKPIMHHGTWEEYRNPLKYIVIRNYTYINQWVTCVTIIPNFKHIKLANTGIIIRNPYSAQMDLRIPQFQKREGEGQF